LILRQPAQAREAIIVIAWQKIEKTRAVVWGLAGAGVMLLVPGTTTLWRCVFGICVVIASVAWDLNRK
jgi:hypothetical protein